MKRPEQRFIYLGKDNWCFVHFNTSLHYYIFLLLPVQQICMLSTTVQAAQTQVSLLSGKNILIYIYNKYTSKVFKAGVCTLVGSNPKLPRPSQTCLWHTHLWGVTGAFLHAHEYLLPFWIISQQFYWLYLLMSTHVNLYWFLTLYLLSCVQSQLLLTVAMLKKKTQVDCRRNFASLFLFSIYLLKAKLYSRLEDWINFHYHLIREAVT